MNAQGLYLLFISLIGITDIAIFLKFRIDKNPYPIRMKKNRYSQIVDYVKKTIDEKEINRLFKQSGLKIKPLHYQMIRYGVMLGWLGIIAFSYFLEEKPFPSSQLFMVLFIFLLTSPKDYYFGKKKTLFRYVLDLVIQSYKSKRNIEIYRALSQLKNIAIAKQYEAPGSDFILEQIRKFTRSTRPIFNRMIALWSMGRRDEACDYLGQAIDTKEAWEFANLLRKLDNLKPEELKGQLILLQENIKKERETAKLKSNENRSNLLYFVVVSTSIIILINFVIVVYYIESINQLKYLN